MGRFRIVTLNTWFLPGLCKDFRSRALKLVDRAVSLNADVLALQEVWPQGLKKRFQEEFSKKGYPYIHISKPKRRIDLRGFVGNGLMTVSKLPISPVGAPIDFKNYTHPAEYFVDKGALHSKINHPKFGEFDFFNVHLGAPRWNNKAAGFTVKDTETIFGHGRVLCREVEKRAKLPVKLLAGDFNFSRTKDLEVDIGDRQSELSRELQLINSSLGVSATCEDLVPSRFNTVDHLNPYFAGGQFKFTPARQLDHIFYSANSPSIRLAHSEVVLKSDPISDHYGVVADFDF